MKIQVAVLSALVAYCTANRELDLSADIPADSKLGNSLLSKARRVNQNAEEDFTWMTSYSIKFNSCHTIHQFGGEMEGGGQEEGQNPVKNQHLVNFKLCPSDQDMDKCKYGGEYVVEMREFLEVYLEAKQELEEQLCEAVAENCNCDYYNGDDEACAAQCYSQAGYDFCVQDEEFDVNEYIECAEAAFSNNEYYATTFYVGPVCDSSGSAVYMDVFKDMSCSKSADSGTYQKYNYGASLPYSSKSIIDSASISCKEVDENAYYNQYNNYEQAEPIELCQMVYMQSAKCEDKMSKNNQDVGSCTYINNILPSLESVYKKGGSGGGKVGTILAWIFFITTLAVSAGMYHFYVIAKRKTVNLNSNSGVQMSGGIL